MGRPASLGLELENISLIYCCIVVTTTTTTRNDKDEIRDDVSAFTAAVLAGPSARPDLLRI